MTDLCDTCVCVTCNAYSTPEMYDDFKLAFMGRCKYTLMNGSSEGHATPRYEIVCKMIDSVDREIQQHARDHQDEQTSLDDHPYSRIIFCQRSNEIWDFINYVEILIRLPQSTLDKRLGQKTSEIMAILRDDNFDGKFSQLKKSITILRGRIDVISELMSWANDHFIPTREKCCILSMSHETVGKIALELHEMYNVLRDALHEKLCTHAFIGLSTRRAHKFGTAKNIAKCKVVKKISDTISEIKDDCRRTGSCKDEIMLSAIEFGKMVMRAHYKDHQQYVPTDE